MFVEALRARLKVLDDEILRLTMLASDTPISVSRTTTGIWHTTYSARRENFVQR